MEAIRPTKINEHSLDTFLAVLRIQKNKINIQSQSLLLTERRRLSSLLARVIGTEELGKLLGRGVIDSLSLMWTEYLHFGCARQRGTH